VTRYERGDEHPLVMAGLVPAIHVFLATLGAKQDVDARHKAGQDGGDSGRYPDRKKFNL
jgi:hypothetical protein